MPKGQCCISFSKFKSTVVYSAGILYFESYLVNVNDILLVYFILFAKSTEYDRGGGVSKIYIYIGWYLDHIDGSWSMFIPINLNMSLKVVGELLVRFLALIILIF